MTVGEAMICMLCLQLANKKQIDDIKLLKHSITKSFEELKLLFWPPTTVYFDSVSVEKQIPKSVLLFFKVFALISGCECHDNELMEKLASSIDSIYVIIFLLAFG